MFKSLGDLTKIFDQGVLQTNLKKALDQWVMLSLPIACVAMLGAILGNVGQFGLLWSSKPIEPDLKRINPLAGFKKLFSKDRAVDLVKQLGKFAVVLMIMYSAVKDALADFCLLSRLEIISGLKRVSDLVSLIIFKVFLGFFLIAILDFFWQRYAFLKSMRMSKYEVKKEYKQQEGDPQIKQERRRIHQETLESLSLNQVQDAAVVITNPQHLAVALKYDEPNDGAPIVVAKGTGLLAKMIREKANFYRIPIMRNVSLARDLQYVDLNEEIPRKLYDSVAEILLFVHELNEASKEAS